MSEATTGIDTALRREPPLGASAREVIRSPEQVALDLVIAGPMSRVLAFSIDYSILLIVETIVLVGLFFAAMTLIEINQITTFLEQAQEDLGSGDVSARPWLMVALAVWVVLEFVLQFGYFVASELLMQGRSPGKALIGLRVVRDGGLPLTARESILRNLLRVVDMLPVSYLVGLVSMVLSEQTRRLGDYGAGTLVVRDEKSPPAPPIEIDAEPAPGAPAFRFDRQQLAALGPVERRLARQTLRRLEGQPRWKRKKLLARAVEVLRVRIGHAEELAAEDQRAFLMALLRDSEER
jgi:uncharacterized RDD family membrane protein YckC